MPPEPLPWDRKDFFKEKKHERFDFGGSLPRWRDSHHGGGSREFARWGTDEFRRPLGHGKQGGYQLSSEESSHGCTPSRSSERMVEDESSIRPFTSRGDGRYGRNNREIRGSFSQKDWRGHPRETGEGFVNSLGRHHHDAVAQRSVSSDLITSHPHSDIESSSWGQIHLKDEYDKMGGFDGWGTGQRHDKEQSLGSIPWKPLKWNRSNSLSSRGSGFSHSSSSRSMRADSSESKPELPPGRTTPVRSPSMDASGGVQSAMFEETCSRKKQRLGWGQGLAKYEKQKVEGPDEIASESVSVPCSTNTKTTQSIISTLPDRSPRVAGLSECSSPPTPTSFACSSSPGMEDKSHVKGGAKDDDHTSNLSASPVHTFQNFVEGFSINLDHLELTSSSNLSCLLNDLLQPEDASSGDSNFVRSAAKNKLLLLKTEFLKAVERTEFEIDLCENELKLLNSELNMHDHCSTASEALQLECESKPCEEVVVSNIFQKSVPLQLDSFDSMLVDKPILCDKTLSEGPADVIEDDMDSPGTATSKFVESLSAEKAFAASDNLKHGTHFVDDVAERSTFHEGHGLFSVDEKSIVVSGGTGDGNLLNETNTKDRVSSDLSLPSEGECNLSVSILESNRDSARQALEVFSNLLPSNHPQIDDIWEASRVACQRNNLLIKEKLAARKCFQRFKERVLTLKYRAFQHLWREDMRLLSIRKYRAKSQKRSESSLRISHNGYQKHRSSIRSRFTSPAGNLSLVPTTDIVDFTSKVLSDSQIKLHRNSLKMPALILDKKERSLTRFVTSNGLVEDPCLVEKERMMINPWTPSEKKVFMELLATFGKDFKRIASFLNHKTTADCIEFYYKNHKSEGFEKIKIKLDVSKQGRNCPTNTYLNTSGKKWNPEVNAVSLDVLGAASVIAAQADESVKTQQSSVGRSLLGAHYNYKPSCGDFTMLGKSNSSDILGNEREAVAADVLAGICAALSSEAVSSCVTSSVDLVEGCPEWKFQKRNSVVDRPLTPEVMQNIDCEEACSDDSSGDLDTVDWTDEEKSIFIRAFGSYGKNFAKISRCVGTRSRNQCKVFFGKARKCLGLDLTHLGSGNECTTLSDTCGGRSDTNDACVLEMESALCSTQSCTKMDVDLPSIVSNTNSDLTGHANIPHTQTEHDRSRGNNGMDQLECEDTDLRKELPNYCWDGIKPELETQIERKSSATPELLRCNDETMEDSTLSCELPVQAHGKGDLTSATEALEDRGTGQVASLIDESVCAGRPSGLVSSSLAAAVDLRATPGAFTGRLKTESVQLKILVPENNDRQDLEGGVHMDSSRSSSGYFVLESRTNRSSSHLEDEKTVCPGFTSTPNYQQKISLQVLPSAQESQVISWQQKENFPSVSANMLSKDSAAIHYEDHLQQPRPSSTLHFEDRQNQKLGISDVYHPYVLGRHSLNRFEATQILRGYPLKVLSKEMINGDTDMICSEKHTMVQNFSNVIRNSQSNQIFSRNIYLEKCNGVSPSCSVAELPLPAKGNEQTSSDRSRSHSRSSSDTEEHSRRVGDVKLFGQILSHPSPLQTPSATTQKTENKSSSNSFDVKFIDHGKDGASVASKLVTGNYSGLEDYPIRSYGFWDGSRIQTGFSSLPESAILLPNYPTGFSDYSSASTCVDQQQPLQSVYKRKDRNLGCVSVFPTKDINGNRGLAEVYRSSYDGTNDVKRHDIYSEIQKRNGCEMISGFQQQQVRGVVGLNSMGSGILVGGGVGCTTGVSDPVTAIKMHYAATTDRYGGGQAGSIREEESRRGGDRGR